MIITTSHDLIKELTDQTSIDESVLYPKFGVNVRFESDEAPERHFAGTVTGVTGPIRNADTGIFNTLSTNGVDETGTTKSVSVTLDNIKESQFGTYDAMYFTRDLAPWIEADSNNVIADGRTVGVFDKEYLAPGSVVACRMPDGSTIFGTVMTVAPDGNSFTAQTQTAQRTVRLVTVTLSDATHPDFDGEIINAYIPDIPPIDDIAPVVIAVGPPNGATNVNVDLDSIVVVFSKPIDTDAGGTVTLRGASNVALGVPVWMAGNVVAVFAVKGNIRETTEYTVTVKDYVDTVGNVMDEAHTSTFTTGLASVTPTPFPPVELYSYNEAGTSKTALNVSVSNNEVTIQRDTVSGLGLHNHFFVMYMNESDFELPATKTYTVRGANPQPPPFNLVPLVRGEYAGDPSLGIWAKRDGTPIMFQDGVTPPTGSDLPGFGEISAPAGEFWVYTVTPTTIEINLQHRTSAGLVPIDKIELDVAGNVLTINIAD